MAEQKFPTTATPPIQINVCQGDLVVRGWSEDALLVKGEDIQVDEDKAGFSLTAAGDMKLMLPEKSALAIQSVSGDLNLKNIRGDLSLGTCHGDVILNGIDHVKIQEIHQDLSAKNFDGPLHAQLIHGDAVVRRAADINFQMIHGDFSGKSIAGNCQIVEAQGDIALRAINGDLSIEKGQRDVNLANLGGQIRVQGVQGDIRLQGGLSEGDHLFEAERDILVRWPYTAPLNFTATGTALINRLQLDKAVEVDNTLTGRLGDGETNVTFKAGGRFIMKESQIVDSKWDTEFDGNEFIFDFADLGAHISAQVNDQISRVTEQITSTFGPEFTDQISLKVARKAQEAAKMAEKAAERARQQAERQSAHYSRPAPPKPAAKAKASKEEQMKILEMVEQGKITPDEAAILLDALEG